jgi:hypothetical protein
MIKNYILFAGTAGFVCGFYYLTRRRGNKSYSAKDWVKAGAFILFLFLCYAGALLLFIPGISAGFGLGAALATAIPSAACWAALFRILIHYKRHILPLNHTIENIIQRKPSFFSSPLNCNNLP